MDEPPGLAHLECALERFLDGRLSSTQLHALCWDELAPADDLSNLDPLVQLWHAVVVNLAFYHYCDFEHDVLETSVRLLIESVRTTGRGRLTPITASRCFIDALKQHTIPVPLQPHRFHAVLGLPAPGKNEPDGGERGKPGAV